MSDTARVTLAAVPEHLRWLIRLRWLAGAAMVVGGLADGLWLGWYGSAVPILLVGVFILLFNTALWLRLPAILKRSRRRGMVAAGGQIAVDLACLTLLVVWTGGIQSPLLGFFVFHMVFSSLLLPPVLAYGGALLAIGMIGVGLWLTDQWPRVGHGNLTLVGWVVTLLLTVWLANHITQRLLHQRQRLVRQNRRVKAMSDQLRQQQQAMIQHEKMVTVGQMAAGIAHEIANPLASMDSLLQLLLRRPERMGAESIQTLRDQVQRINEIIQQMRSFSHPGDADSAEVELNEVVEQALAMVGFDERLRRVRIVRELSPGAGRVRVQRLALQQVLVNLVINALDAMEDVSEPTLTIRTAAELPWGLVEVRDNGHGIAPEDLPRLFEPFFTTKSLGKGTGLGLPICLHLLQRYGGDIQAHGGTDSGAVFVIRLPSAQSASRNRETSGEPLAASGKQAS